MQTVLGDRKTVLTRELTKVHEQVIRGSLSEVKKQLEAGSMKGEFTIIIQAAIEEPMGPVDTLEYLKKLMLHRCMSKKEAVAIAAEEIGMPKKEVYKKSLNL
jgi:16S rRNA (cytidine1402-2'-O)-methyltransferase